MIELVNNFIIVFLIQCLETGNLAAASLLETLSENHEQALKHNLEAAGANSKDTETAIDSYVDAVGNNPSIEQVPFFIIYCFKFELIITGIAIFKSEELLNFLTIF